MKYKQYDEIYLSLKQIDYCVNEKLIGIIPNSIIHIITDLTVSCCGNVII